MAINQYIPFNLIGASVSAIKIHLMSDLHNEFSGYTWEIPETDSDLIILAGDIGVGLIGVEWVIRQSERLNKPIIYIFGNHEFYDSDLSLISRAKAYCKDTNVHILENDIFYYGEYKILGCTLWTDYLLYGEVGKFAAMKAANDFMADHRLIDNGKFKPADAEKLFKKSIKWIKKNLTGTKDIVVTHHVPNHFGTHPKYRGDMCSPAFASDLEGFILDRQPMAWFSGHSHYNYKKLIGKTLCRSNVRGYPAEGILHFEPKLVVELM